MEWLNYLFIYFYFIIKKEIITVCLNVSFRPPDNLYTSNYTDRPRDLYNFIDFINKYYNSIYIRKHLHWLVFINYKYVKFALNNDILLKNMYLFYK